jgi:hypothetical protein
MKLSVFAEYSEFIYRGCLKKNSFPNTLNEVQHFRRKRRKLSLQYFSEFSTQTKKF